MSSNTQRRVLLVGWDAADWRWIRPLIEQNRLSCLAGLIQRGVSAPLISRPPLIPSATWITALTGIDADVHGILTDIEPDGLGDVHPPVSTSRRKRALWNVLSEHGIKSCIVGFPATHPAEHIHGVIVSDRFLEAQGTAGKLWPADPKSVWPSDPYDQLQHLRMVPADISRSDLQEFVSNLPEVPNRSCEHLSLLADLLARCATTHNVATWLMERGNWQFFAVRYRFLAAICHAFTKFAQPLPTNAASQDDANYGQVIQVSYQFLDLMLERLVQLAGNDATVLVVSNHGFEQNPRPIVPPPYDEADPRREQVQRQQHSAEPFYDRFLHHRPQGILVAAGSDLPTGTKLPAAGLLDLFPTLSQLLGVSVQNHAQGKSLFVVSADEQPAELGPHQAASPADDGSWPAGTSADPWFAQEIIDRLTSVGLLQSNWNAAAAVAQSQLGRLLAWGRALYERRCWKEALVVYQQLAALDDSFYPLVHIAECFLALRQIQAADSAIAEVEQRAPSAVVSWAMRAQWHMLRMEHVTAALLLERAVQQEPTQPQLALQLGWAHLAAGDNEAAQAAFQQTLRLDQDQTSAYRGLSICLERMGQAPLAQAHRELSGYDPAQPLIAK